MTRPIETSRDLTLPFTTDLALKRRFMVVDEPLAGNIRFDLLLEVLDKLAEDAALDYARRFAPEGRVVTAAIDNILLREPGDVNREGSRSLGSASQRGSSLEELTDPAR